MKNTKGPWKILPVKQQEDGRTYTITGWVEGEHCNMIGNQNCRIADVYSIESNAHLIAAAPELLSALKALIDSLDMEMELDHMLDCTDPKSCVLCRAKETIKKAEGK